MTVLELLLLAVTLCFDTFAVSVGGGLSLRNVKFSKKAVIMAFFASFQAGLLFLGWITGSLFASHIMDWDHWIAFAILLYIGGKMILDNFSEVFGKGKKEGEDDNECGCKKGVDLLNYRTLAILSVATSIDAIAVGVSLALVDITAAKIGFTIAMTFLFTALASYTGLVGGEKIGCRIGAKASIFGGIVLVLIGVKIVAEHIFF